MSVSQRLFSTEDAGSDNSESKRVNLAQGVQSFVGFRDPSVDPVTYRDGLVGLMLGVSTILALDAESDIENPLKVVNAAYGNMISVSNGFQSQITLQDFYPIPGDGDDPTPTPFPAALPINTGDIVGLHVDYIQNEQEGQDIEVASWTGIEVKAPLAATGIGSYTVKTDDFTNGAKGIYVEGNVNPASTGDPYIGIDIGESSGAGPADYIALRVGGYSEFNEQATFNDSAWFSDSVLVSSDLVVNGGGSGQAIFQGAYDAPSVVIENTGGIGLQVSVEEDPAIIVGAAEPPYTFAVGAFGSTSWKGATVNTPSSTQVITSSSTPITLSDATILRVSTGGSSITLDSVEPIIAAGTEGQIIRVYKVGSGTLTLCAESSTYGDTDLTLATLLVALGEGDSIELMYASELEGWVQIGYTNVDLNP